MFRLSLRRAPATRASPASAFARNYSKNIDDFNSTKKPFSFGPAVDKTPAGAAKNPQKTAFPGSDLPDVDPADPRLAGLRPNLPEYKQTLFAMQQEDQQSHEKNRARYEFYERVKGLSAGILALAGVIAAYQLAMNYKSLKAAAKNWWHFDIDTSRMKDMNDPSHNRKSIASLVDRLSADIDASFVAGVRDSRAVPGLYLFGAVNGKKLPTRVLHFDGMLLDDVLVLNDYVVAVDSRGRVLHYSKKLQQPVEVSMPLRIASVVLSGGNFYYVSRNGKDIYFGGRLAGLPPRKWLSSAVSYDTDKLSANLTKGERFASVSAGQQHLLLLTSTGRLFEVNTAEQPINKGQFGLPTYAALTQVSIPTNIAFELTNLNNEVVASKGAKEIRPRQFKAIATTAFSNAAVTTNGEIWTWGDNSSSQCGRDASSSVDTQPVPRMAYSLRDLAQILKYSLPNKGAGGEFSVDALYGTNDTFYIKLGFTIEGDDSKKQDLVLSFGNGLQGQLGISRYMQMTSKPQVIKSLAGMQEYDEDAGRTQFIGTKSIVGGGSHVFVTMDNAGAEKEVMVFGDNDKGQFGNGKAVKSGKPVQVPKLLEPTDFASSTKSVARKVNNQAVNRLQLTDGVVPNAEQVIVAGQESSAIFYRHK